MRGSATELTLAKEERTPRVVEQLDHLDLCRNYIRAFGEAIGLPLIWVSSEEVHESSHKTPHINPFRKWMARHHGVCENCLYSPLNQLTPEGSNPRTETCFAGLCKSSVPIRINPHFPALWSDPMAVSKTSRRKQIPSSKFHI